MCPGRIQALQVVLGLLLFVHNLTYIRRIYSMNRVDHTEAYLNTLPERHQVMLSEYRYHLNKTRYCIDENHQIIRKIIQHTDTLFENENRTVVTDSKHVARLRTMDLDKVQVTLKQFARDWSVDGELERTQCYKPIIEEVMHCFNPNEM